MARSAELELGELEEKLLIMVDQAWEAWEAGGAGFPPATLLNLITKAHDVISKRLKNKLGQMFDPENPEASLIQIERIREMILKQLEQKRRLRAVS